MKKSKEKTSTSPAVRMFARYDISSSPVVIKDFILKNSNIAYF